MSSRTRNLKLVLEDNLTDSARYNLQKIDSLGAVFNLDNTDSAVIRSKENIIFRPQDASIGGTGTGGTISFGTASQPLDTLEFHAGSVNLGAMSLSDTASGGSKVLNLVYQSDASGSTDTSADRSLIIDTEGGDRQLVLGGNFTLLGAGLTLSLSSPLSWTLPSGNGTAGQVLSTDGSGTLSWTSAGVTGNSMVQSWTSGTSLTVTHNWGTRNIMVDVLDTGDDYRDIEMDITRPTPNTVVITAGEAPTGTWLVLLKEIV